MSKREIKLLPFHPLADKFPRMEGKELNESSRLRARLLRANQLASAPPWVAEKGARGRRCDSP